MRLELEDLKTLAYLAELGINAEKHPCKQADEGERVLKLLRAEITKQEAVEEVRQLKEKLAQAESRVSALVQHNDQLVRTGQPRAPWPRKFA